VAYSEETQVKPASNKPLQLTKQSVTKFAYANLSPLSFAAERRR
jgi:hypothetical protein